MSPRMTPTDVLAAANELVSIIARIAGQIATLRAIAVAGGATDAELDTLDAKLTAAIAARELE